MDRRVSVCMSSIKLRHSFTLKIGARKDCSVWCPTWRHFQGLGLGSHKDCRLKPHARSCKDSGAALEVEIEQAQHGTAWQSMGNCGDALMRHLHELSTHRWILPVMGPWAHGPMISAGRVAWHFSSLELPSSTPCVLAATRGIRRRFWHPKRDA